jgi:hypothetical protein
MKIAPVVLSAIAAAGAAVPLAAPAAYAADPREMSKDIIAVQIRKQGFECKTPQKAERDQTSGNPDDPIWTLTCENAVYRVHLIPNQAAKVERLPDEQKSSQAP